MFSDEASKLRKTRLRLGVRLGQTNRREERIKSYEIERTLTGPKLEANKRGNVLSSILHLVFRLGTFCNSGIEVQ